MSEPQKNGWLKRLTRGQWMSLDTYKRHLPIIITVVVLFIIYISFKFDVQMKIAQIMRLNEELANAKTNMVSASSKYASEIRESELTEKLDTMHLYLKVAEQPPYYLDKQKSDDNGK